MSLDINLTNVQSIPIVVNANITAENNKVYHVVANATFTDPTPVEGRGYVVFVRNGTATVGGSNLTVGMMGIRIFHSGSWTTNRQDRVGVVPESRTINGLNLASNITLTTANINDSTNKRYVTDAQLTVLGNTTNTNSGDETQSSILSKLGWFYYNRVAESTAVTGTTETIIENIKINANTFASGGILRSYNNKFRKVGTAGSLTVRLYISPNNNNLTGATQIATTSIPAANLFIEILRTFTATTTSLIGWNSAISSTNDVTVSTSARTETAVTWTNDQYFIITVQLANAGDSVSLIGASLKNF